MSWLTDILNRITGQGQSVDTSNGLPPELLQALTQNPVATSVGTLTGATPQGETAGQKLERLKNQGDVTQAQSWYESGDPLLTILNGARDAGAFNHDAATRTFNDALGASNNRGDRSMDSALRELRTPANIDLAGNYQRDVGQLSNIPEVNLDKVAADQMASIGRQANYNAKTNARNIGASMASRGLAGSGAYTHAVGNAYTDANRNLAAESTNLANVLAGRKLEQRGQNNTMAQARGNLGLAYSGLEQGQRGQNIGLQGARAGVQQAQGQNYYSQALPAAQSAVTNMYAPINQAANASNMFYGTYYTGVPNGAQQGMSLQSLLSGASPFYSSAGSMIGSGYQNAGQTMNDYLNHLYQMQQINAQRPGFDVGAAIGTTVDAVNTVAGLPGFGKN